MLGEFLPISSWLQNKSLSSLIMKHYLANLNIDFQKLLLHNRGDSSARSLKYIASDLRSENNNFDEMDDNEYTKFNSFTKLKYNRILSKNCSWIFSNCDSSRAVIFLSAVVYERNLTLHAISDRSHVAFPSTNFKICQVQQFYQQKFLSDIFIKRLLVDILKKSIFHALFFFLALSAANYEPKFRSLCSV